MPKPSTTVRTGKRPDWVCCNRHAQYLRDAAPPSDLDEFCTATFGPAAQKCGLCQEHGHLCVELDQASWPHMNRWLDAREKLAAVMRDPMGSRRQEEAARASFDEACEAMKTQLKVMNVNRKKMTGDKHTPRKKAAGGAPAAGMSNAVLVEEVQGLRRAMQALVQGAKGSDPEEPAGEDAEPPSTLPSGDEQGTPSGGANAQQQKASLAAKRKREQRRQRTAGAQQQQQPQPVVEVEDDEEEVEEDDE
ncbi:hypothetical protein KC354_g18246 [Hortaea werneckii]|nr:hypothetical protein KC354_g18246 [Hortaea werneckii]